jgi:hypothetical protein
VNFEPKRKEKKMKRLNLILLVIFVLFNTSNLFSADVYVQFRTFNEIKFKFSLPTKVLYDYQEKFEFYKGDTLLKTYINPSPGYYYYFDTGLQKDTTYTYKTKTYYRTLENGSWTDWKLLDSGEFQVTTDIITGTIDENIIITGKGKITDIYVAEGTTVTFKNADLTSNKLGNENIYYQYSEIIPLKNAHIKVIN